MFVFILLVRNAAMPRYPLEISLEAVGLSGEEVHFQSRDGTLLSGTLISGGKEHPIIILCHGVGANRYDLVDIARMFHQRGGWGLFLFDFRAHGRSRGRLSSFGNRERDDLLGAMDFLDGREDISHRYGLYGVSMGGSVGILVAAEDERIRALCADSPFADLEKSMEDHLHHLYRLPKVPFLYLTALSYRILFGSDVRKISPIRVIGKISPRPVYLINGGEDSQMPPARTKALYDAAAEPKKLWLIPGTDHLEGRAVAEETYDASVFSFFETSFKTFKHARRVP